MKAIEGYLPLLESTIKDLDVADEVLGGPMAYALAGGKRLRPGLVLLSADVCGGDWRQLGRAAAAVECVHAYSLIHDDLPAMDDDDLRHGKPTLHRAFDEATAILTGDGLLTLAFALLAEPLAAVPPELQLAAVREVAAGAGFGFGMVGGQALDLSGAKDAAGWLRVAAAKTGYPLGAAAAVGAFLAARADLAQALRSYGRELGIAFQIKDDLLDVQGSEADMGKRLNKDAGKRRPNIAAIAGVAAAEAALRDHSAQAVAALANSDLNREPLERLVVELVARTH